MIVKSVEKKENNNLSFQVEIDSAEFEAALNVAYLKNRKDIAVPGFRKGKAPRLVIEGMYGKGVFYDDAINDLSPDAYDFAIKDQDINAVGRPSLADMDVSEEKVLTLTFETALYPEVTLGEYKNLEAPKPAVDVQDSEVDEEIERVRQRNSRLITADRAAQEGDTAVIDFEGFLDGVPFEGGKGEGHNLELGSGQFVPGFEEQVVGMSAGEEKDVNLTFPEDYHEELAGKDVVFKVKCNEVKFNELPELDDEFVKDVSEFDTLDEYKKDIKENLIKSREGSADEQFKDSLVKKAIENMTAEIPDAMIDEAQDSIVREYAQNLSMQGVSLEQYLGMMGMDQKTFFDTARTPATVQVQTKLLMTKVAEVENIEVSDEDLEAEYKKTAEQYNMEVEKIKELISDEAVKADLRIQKAAEVIFESGIATEPVDEPEETEGDEDKAE